MKKFLLVSMLLCVALLTHAQLKVQGVPRPDIKQIPAMVMPNADGTFTMDDIVNWSGEGENRSALVIQWSLDGEETAMVFGYRWSGSATGADMMMAVVANNPRLYCFTQSGTQYGSTFAGCGWDVDGNGVIGLISPQGDTIYCNNENGYFQASGYSYDGYKSLDATDWWRSGWYSGYWSYWLKAGDAADWKYSGQGISNRKLTDGSWDGWKFNVGPDEPWKPLASAPSLIPDDAPRSFTINGVCYSLLSWSELHKTVAVVAPFEGSGITYQGAIDIPATFVSGEITYEVVAVADSAFAATPQLTVVTLPASVTKIGNDAFLNSGVSSVAVPEQIKTIGTEAFKGCANLAQITIPASMTAIPMGAFAGTGITSLVLPTTVTTVGASAFEGCASLVTLEFAQQVTAIGENAFNGCPLTSVKSISIVPAVCGVQAFDTATTATATLTVPQGFIDTYQAAEVWKDFRNFAEQTIPVNLGDRFAKAGVMYQVTALGDEANEVKVTYYNDKNNINTSNAAGYGGEVNVPAIINYQGIDFTVTEIGDSAMMGASNITALTIADGVKRIGIRGLYNCSKLEALTLPATLQSLGIYAFYNNAFATLVIPAGVTELPNYLFNNCKKMENVTIPETVTKIGDNLFNGCSALKANPLPTTVTEWPLQTFAYCASLTDVVVPETVITLGQGVFANCSNLKSLALPDHFTTIPYRLCYSCAALETLTISAQTVMVDGYAFDGCKLLSLALPQTITELGNNAFNNCNFVEVNLPGLTTMGNYALANNASLTTVNIPNVTTMGNYALANNASLTTVNIPNVTSIGQYAFSACTSLTEFVLPQGVTKLNPGTFSKCSNLTKVSGLAGITDIPQHCFSSCAALTDLDFGSEIKTIGNYAFDGCTSLTDFELGEALTAIGQYGFRNCTGIKDFVFPPTMGRITTSDVFFGDTQGHLWSTLEKPQTMGNYTFRTVSASPMQYLPVTVLTGTKDKYTELAGWKNCEINEPEVAGLAALNPHAEVTQTTATVSIEAAVAYVDSLPEAFAKYNDVRVLNSLPEAAVEYRLASLPAAVSMLNVDGDEVMTEPATLADGVYTAELSDLQANTTYQYRLVLADAEGNKVYSDWQEFTTEAGVTGVDRLLNAKPVDGVTYYNAQGQQATRAFDGVNIVVIRYADGTRIVTKLIK